MEVSEEIIDMVLANLEANVNALEATREYNRNGQVSIAEVRFDEGYRNGYAKALTDIGIISKNDFQKIID